ncbi:hypothetical protein [Roseobacter sp. HKCCA0434]|nr:hypothetical protein [Roseobacter sp. HKCCA0434]
MTGSALVFVPLAGLAVAVGVVIFALKIGGKRGVESRPRSGDDRIRGG